jgi:hypothetical protein
MAVTVFPAPAAGGGIKSIQRGSTSVAGTITISAVDMAKTTVYSFSTASTGVIALAGSLSGTIDGASTGGAVNPVGISTGSRQMNVNLTAAGSTNTLVSKVAGAYLSSSTQITTTGACRYEVVEFA